MRPYLSLIKPRISLLFAITGFTAILVQRAELSSVIPSMVVIPSGIVIPSAARDLIITLAIFLVGGSANAFNQYLEREIDSRMTRTASKRPLPLGQISPNQALIFSIFIGVSGALLLLGFGTPLASLLGLGTILFYSFFYTLWLKPKTPYNIVIGGIAGAMGPIIGSAAITGTIGVIPFLMFLLIFFWTPPHFWALALYHQDDYRKVGLPMLPVVRGEAVTRRQILLYSLTLAPLSAALYLVSDIFDIVYLLAALTLSGLFIWFAFRVYREKSVLSYQRLFRYSIGYLTLLYLVMMLDAAF